MRRLVTVLAIFIFVWPLGISAQGGPSANDPKPIKKLEAIAEEEATSVRVISTWQAPAQPVDSIVITTTMASVLVTHQKPGTALADTATFPLSSVPPGTSVGGQVDVLTRRRGLSGPVVTTQFNFTRADTPPPPVGAVTVKADSI